jgi:hypothetical protein
MGYSKLSVIAIKNNGLKFDSCVAEHFIEELVNSTGKLYSSKDNYELWGYPKECPRMFYVLKVTESDRRKVIKPISPIPMINMAFSKLGKVVKEKEVLTQKIAGLKKKDKIVQETDLVDCIKA